MGPSSVTNLVPAVLVGQHLFNEIGHTLGLKHLGNYNAGETSTHVVENLLQVSKPFAPSCHTRGITKVKNVFFGKYDIFGLKFLYGA